MGVYFAPSEPQEVKTRATAVEEVIREIEKDSKILYDTDFCSFWGRHIFLLRWGQEAHHVRELKISNVVCVTDKAMINVLATPMHRGVALWSFVKSLLAGKWLARSSYCIVRAFHNAHLNLAGLPRKFPAINNPSCLKMAFLDKSVETAVYLRSGYWPNYTTLPPQTKCKNLQSGCCSCSTSAHARI